MSLFCYCLSHLLQTHIWIQKKWTYCIEQGNHHHGKAPVLEVDVKHLGPVEFLEFPAMVGSVAVFFCRTAVYLYHLSVVQEMVTPGWYQRYIHYTQETIAAAVKTPEQHIAIAK